MFKPEIAEIAAAKMRTGMLLTTEEAGAVLGVSPVTLHRLPIPSIRMRGSLRFDPRDVASYIESSKEAVAA